jgi:protein-L-isoaspartate O-methyltransferase
VVNPVMIGDTIALRERMVHAQLMARGISDERVFTAMRERPREPFIPERYRDQAYSDQPLSIWLGPDNLAALNRGVHPAGPVAA